MSNRYNEYLPIGAKIEFGKNLEQALTREVQEEIGISINKYELLLETPPKPTLGKPDKTVTAFWYLIFSDQEVDINNKIQELLWISRIKNLRLALSQTNQFYQNLLI